MPTTSTEKYIPAAGRGWLTALYDPVMALTMRERAFRGALIATVLSDPPPRLVVDVGCGTGTLAVQLAESDPSVEVIGVDGDERVLGVARKKAARLGERVRFEQGLADRLPVATATVDVVVASLLLHHLRRDAKLRALREAHRVLAPGGHRRLGLGPRQPRPDLRLLILRIRSALAGEIDWRP